MTFSNSVLFSIVMVFSATVAVAQLRDPDPYSVITSAGKPDYLISGSFSSGFIPQLRGNFILQALDKDGTVYAALDINICQSDKFGNFRNCHVRGFPESRVALKLLKKEVSESDGITKYLLEIPGYKEATQRDFSSVRISIIKYPNGLNEIKLLYVKSATDEFGSREWISEVYPLKQELYVYQK